MDEAQTNILYSKFGVGGCPFLCHFVEINTALAPNKLIACSAMIHVIKGNYVCLLKQHVSCWFAHVMNVKKQGVISVIFTLLVRAKSFQGSILKHCSILGQCFRMKASLSDSSGRSVNCPTPAQHSSFGTDKLSLWLSLR